MLIFFLGIQFPSGHREPIPILAASFPFKVVYYAIKEEFLFRFIPLVAAVLFFRKKHGTLNIARISLVVAISFSCWFGFLHGGIVNIGFQGFLGLILSVAFLKCGGLQRHYLMALMSSMALHAAFNFFVAAIALLFGGEAL